MVGSNAESMLGMMGRRVRGSLLELVGDLV